MSWTEKAFLAAVLVVTGAVLVFALDAVGVDIPFLSEATPELAEWDIPENGFQEPPPLPDDGLLAELGAEGELSGPPPLPAVPRAGAIGGSDGSAEEATPTDAALAADPEGEKERDPLVDQMKAKVDLSDAGQVLGFLIATFTPRGTKLSEEDLEFLFEALDEQEDWGVRNLLFAHLERIGGEGVTKGVLAFMEGEKNPMSLARAMGTLRKLNDEAAVNGLVEYMATTKNGRLRETAFKNLLGTKNAAATAPLLEALDHADNPQVKRFALAALSQLGGEAGADAVVRYASSSDPYERSLGVKSMRDIRSKEAVPVLGRALETEQSPQVRTQLIRTIGRIRDVSGVQPLSQVALYGSSRGLRLEAMKGLASIGRAEAIPALQSIAETDQNKAMKRSALRTISYIEKVEARRAAREARNR